VGRQGITRVTAPILGVTRQVGTGGDVQSQWKLGGQRELVVCAGS
jgi:hypothetical protein